MADHHVPPNPAEARVNSWGRLAAVVAVGAAVGFAVPVQGWLLRLVSGWDAAALTLIAVSWRTILRSTSAQTHARAASEDPGRAGLGLVALAASAVSLGVAAFVLERAAKLMPGAPGVAVAIAVTAVVGAWFLTHTVYAFRYAHLYYSCDEPGGEPDGGLEFPGDHAPNDRDFAYFAFVLGMTFQVSDVQISSPRLRWAALWHGVISFWYNAAVLALTLNVIGGLL
jgi:uncharacterized membrane protein